MNKIICDCGCEIREDGLKNHKKTKKHNDLINCIIKKTEHEEQEEHNNYEHGGDYWDNLNGVNFDDY